jgi:thiamine biosynthesis lipoprotein
MGHFWTHRGKKYGHVIDPIRGLPVTESRMATVITPSATDAEALTKPLVILGNRGLTMIRKLPQTEGIVIPEQGSLFFSNDFRSKAKWRELPAT